MLPIQTNSVSIKKDFESFLKNHLKSCFSFPGEKGAVALKTALSYCLFPSASRFRPHLCFATAECLGRKPRDIFPLAAAIEMIHCGSLAQDDLPSMDNDLIRRGKPACHLAFGEDLALLAGNCLFVEAFSLLNNLELSLSKMRQLLRLLTVKAGFQGMMGGQALDIRKSSPSKNFFLSLYQLKTGALIEAAIEGPALMWATRKEILDLKHFARELGVAYQISDDLQDRENTPLSSEEELENFTKAALRSLQPFKEKAAPLRSLVLWNKKRGFKKPVLKEKFPQVKPLK